MRRLGALVLVAAAACSGGDGESASSVLAEAEERLDDVDSGEVTLALTASSGEGEEVGFSVSGPFEVPEAGEVARGDLEYVRHGVGPAGEGRASARLVSDGRRAVVVTGGEACFLGEAELASLRGTDDEPSGGFPALGLEGWFPDPVLDEERTVRGEVEPLPVLASLLRFASALGAEVPELDGEAREELARVARGGRGLVEVDGEGYLRRLAVTLELAAPPEVEPELAALVRTRMRFDARIGDPNGPVEVEVPEAGKACATGRPR